MKFHLVPLIHWTPYFSSNELGSRVEEQCTVCSWDMVADGAVSQCHCSALGEGIILCIISTQKIKILNLNYSVYWIHISSVPSQNQMIINWAVVSWGLTNCIANSQRLGIGLTPILNLNSPLNNGSRSAFCMILFLLLFVVPSLQNYIKCLVSIVI